MAGTHPPSAPPPGLREVAQWLLLASFLSKRSLGSSLHPFQDFRSERTTVWDSRPPHKELCRMVEPWLDRTKQGKDLGPASGNCYWRASGHGPRTLPPPLLADTGLLDTRVSLCLSPAFGSTLHLIPDSLANPCGRPVCRERAGQKKKPRFWIEVCQGCYPAHACM